MDEITGAPGELINRLLKLMRGDGPLSTRRTYTIGVYMAGAIGGRMLSEVVPVSPDDEPFPPGTLGAINRAELENVSYDTWVSMFGERLTELTRLGIDESFLVRALRDFITSMYEGLADVGEASSRRNEVRDGMLGTIEDPVRLEEYRNKLAETDPSVLDMHLDQFGDQVRELAEKLGAPFEVDDVTERWADLEAWRSTTGQELGDTVVQDWDHRNALRGLRG